VPRPHHPRGARAPATTSDTPAAPPLASHRFAVKNIRHSTLRGRAPPAFDLTIGRDASAVVSGGTQTVAFDISARNL
jgi:hypothetical protein